MDLTKFRKLVKLDENDALSRFALGKKLLESAGDGQPDSPAAAGTLAEAAEHLSFANRKDPTHLATYQVLAQVLIRLGRTAEAKPILEAGIERVAGVGEGMGRDLGPAMREMLDRL